MSREQNKKEQNKNPNENDLTMKLGPVIRTAADLEKLAKKYNIEQPTPQEPNPFATEPYAELKNKLRQFRQELLQKVSNQDKIGESINQIIEEMEGRSPQEIAENRFQEEENIRRNAQKLPSSMWSEQLRSYKEAQDIFSKNPYNSPNENQAAHDEFAWKIAIAEEEFAKRRKESDEEQPEELSSASQSGLKGFMGRVFGKK